MTQATAEEQVMSKIMKLMALANDDGATPAERKLAEEQADRLMAKHMIDRMEAEEAAKRAGGNQSRKPIVDTWELVLSEHRAEFAGGNYEFDNHVVDMMKYVLKHCNVRVNPDFKYGGKSGYSSREYQIVGFSEDIRYAERIWFNVFKAFISNVNPHWDPEASLGKNAYNYGCAGVQWKHQVLLAEKAGDTRLEFPIKTSWGEPWESSDNKPWWRSVGKLRRECQKYCKENDLMYPYTNGSQLRVVSRVSFARSYRATIKARLDEVRKKAEMHSDIDSNKFAIAVIDTAEKVDEAFYLAFPQYHPDNIKKRREEADFRRACDWASLSPREQQRVLKEEAEEEAKWQRKWEREQRNFKVIREDPSKRINAVAWERGEAAAKSVNLRADEEVKEETKRELT